MALLSAVGETLRTTPRLAADLLAALDGLPVHGVSHPPTGLSLTVFLEDADLAVAVNRVYDWFYRDLEGAAP
jgi:aspartokinase